MTNEVNSLEQAQNICMLGIGGSGMRGLAALLEGRGKIITGTDASLDSLDTDDFITRYKLASEDKAEELITQANLVIYSDSLSNDHPLRRYADEQHKVSLPFNAALGELAKEYSVVIAVAGTHGKSSTTAFLAHILVECGLDPTVLLGATVAGWPLGNARLGSKKILVVEADEYRNHFLTLTPNHVVLTSVDFDHPDFFSSPDEVVKSFSALISKLPTGGTVVTTVEARDKIKDISNHVSVILKSLPQVPIPLIIPGTHMQQNAQLAIAAANIMGVDEEKARMTLTSFKGLGRRFELLGRVNSMDVFSDYGHHPTEIATTLHGARASHPQKKLLAIVEPHMEERLVAFFDGYISALSRNCDGVLVCPVYRARQIGAAQHDSSELTAALSSKRDNVEQIQDYRELRDKISALSTQYDMAIAFTAGELDRHLRDVIVKAQ